MRRTHNSSIVFHDGNFIGVNLGSDACTEHECGWSALKATLGMDESRKGIESRIILDDRSLHYEPWTEKHPWATLVSRRNNYWGELAPTTAPGKVHYELARIREDPIVAAWSEHDFGIAAYTVYTAGLLAMLVDSIRGGDGCIIPGNHEFLLATGPCVARVSALPDAYKEQLLEADLDRERLHEAARKTGIAERLREAGLGYFALSPHWTDHTKTAVRFWLNPMEQRRYYCGMFSVEDLDLWIQGEGPIMKERK